MGLTGFDTFRILTNHAGSVPYSVIPWRNEIFANAFSKVKAAIASAFSVPSFSLVTA